jgi:hypothetical protein
MALDFRYVMDAYMAVGRGVVMMEQLNSAIDDTRKAFSSARREVSRSLGGVLATFFDPKKALSACTKNR